MRTKAKASNFITTLLGTNDELNNNTNNNNDNTGFLIENQSNIIADNSKYFMEKLNNMENDLKNNNQITYLDNLHFRKGTYRIRQPGIYILKENIILEPNEDDACFPKPTQTDEYPMNPGPYILGFFAGISIESDNVVLDLNGYTISQSIRYYLLQRFFSTIELANSPFIPKPNGDEGTQGPANFGPKFVAANNVIIRNGYLGLSSHHGIHGNAASNVLIENIKIEHFEVGGISLNGVSNVYLREISCYNSLGTKLKVPVNGRFSAAVYIWRTLKLIIDKNLPDYYIFVGRNRLYISDAFRRLDKLIKDTTNIVENGKLENIAHFPPEIYKLFGNPDGFQDCSAVYGIVFNKKGIAVNEFGACDPDCTNANMTNNILIENCSIYNIVFKPNEVVALLTKDAEFQKDFSGSMIMTSNSPWFEITADHLNKFNPEATFINNNNYDLILATQVLLYKYSIDKNIKWAKGVANISNNIINWVNSGYKQLKYYPPLKTARNSDIMGHVMKGAIGIRLDFVKDGYLFNNQINTIINHSPPGISNHILKGYIDANLYKQFDPNSYYHLGHPKSNDTDIGFTGSYVRGVSCIKCESITVNRTEISNLISDNGSVFGIDFINDNINCKFNNNNIKDISASLPNNAIPSELLFKLPNWIPRAIGILLRFQNSDCHGEKNSTNNIKSLVISNSLVIEATTSNFGVDLESQDKINKQKYQITRNFYDHRPAI